MKKDLGVKGYCFPSPVFMIATYNEDGSVDVMNMAWGGLTDYDKVALNLAKEHKTTANIERTKAFTLSIATVDTEVVSDYFGVVSANDDKDKFKKSGFHASKSKVVNAPVIDEYPLTLECEVFKVYDDEVGYRVVGTIKNVLADESILENGEVNPEKINALVFDGIKAGYYALGKKVGQAFKDGVKFNKEVK